MGSQSGLSHSKEFLDLVKSIGEARSKAEEDQIVLNEIETLKRRINEPDIPKRKMKEYIIRLVYAEMLGHDASFGYIHAVKMAHDDNLLTKRTGYLAVTLLLNEDHDLIILIVNTIQKDLKSENYSVVCAALNAVCKLINEETIPAVLPQVVELLGHSNEAVRKKAVMALHRFHQRSSSSVSHLISNFRKRLCDDDPGVMCAALSPLYDLINVDTNSYKDLVISFVNILKQVAERRLPKSYDYHQMPAPFIQIKLLKILALLGSGDKKASEHMYTVVSDVMRKCDSTSNIGNAVLYECICCVSSIHPSPKLLDAAANAVSKFLKSDRHNLKYMGIDALSRLIKISPEIAEQHQLAVIYCLEDPDDTLKRKTFELLYKMTKSSNVEVIVDRMIDYMININDNHYKTEIASRCVELAEEFAPSNHWFIQTMNRVFEHAGDLVNIKVAHNLMKLIAEGFGEDEDIADRQLRSSAVESYLHIIREPKLPSAFLQVICWVLGEYGTADGQYSASYITGKLCDVAEAHSGDDSVKAYAVTAIMKIYAFEIAAGRKVDVLPECQSLIEELSASHSTDLQQRAYELQAVIRLDDHALGSIMPLDASCEDIEIDKSLSFLHGYVQQSLEKGARHYIPENERSGILNTRSLRDQAHREVSTHHLRFKAYELPKPVRPSLPISLSSSTELAPVFEPSVPDAGPSELKLRLDGVQRKWGSPTHSSTEPSTSSSSSSKAHDTSHDSKLSQVQISPEKQKLAASLFGAPSKPEKKPSFTFHNVSKTSSKAGDKCRIAKAVPSETAREKATLQPPPPDLLDMGELSAGTSTTVPSIDPFKQLGGLFMPTQDASSLNHGAVPDILSLYADIPASSHCITAENPFSSFTEPPEKDALVRQMVGNLANQNLNLFSDLLG